MDPNAHPVFKKKGKIPDGLYVAHDKRKMRDAAVCILKMGWVRIAEPLQRSDNVMGTRVTRCADQWLTAMQIDVSDAVYHQARAGNGREEADLGIETVSVAGIIKHHPLAQAMADQDVRQFFPILQYLADRFGTQIIAANRWFPCSKLGSTSDGGYLTTALILKSLEWTCPSRGISHDRDVNAAINLKRLATETVRLAATSGATSVTKRGVLPYYADTRFNGQVMSVRRDVRPSGDTAADAGPEEVGMRQWGLMLGQRWKQRVDLLRSEGRGSEAS